ncbi:hypothetical protein [uncultured Cytophaga sp.]|uniref:hypothetical protein n=1 Tax=uncultured Cytophaga sp. TaxID=160238 RepID=UPI002613F078|nr:hypothetical protein [uncultured Cytophaga sp.]
MSKSIKIDMITFKNSKVFAVSLILFLFQAIPSIAQLKNHQTIRAENLKVVLVKDIENLSDSSRIVTAEDPQKSSFKIIHVSFNMVSSDPKNAGYKSVMMRLVDPKGTDINDPIAGGGLFNLNGVETAYTLKVSSNYDGKFLDVDFLYKHPKHYKKGLHIIELYVDGLKIGEEHFIIK